MPEPSQAQVTYQTITNYSGYIIGNRPVATAWYGDRVALVIDGETAAMAATRDQDVMAQIVTTFDGFFDAYDEVTGRSPSMSAALNGKIRIEVSSLVGGGLANHGTLGIAVGDGFFNGLYTRVGQGTDTYDQVFFYESARNYWMSDMNPRIDYATSTNPDSWGWWTVGFNNAMSVFMPSIIDGISDMYYFGYDGQWFSDQMEANYNTYVNNPSLYNWDNSWNVDRMPWNNNISLNDLMTGTLIHMYDNFGGIDFIKGLYREIPQLPALTGWPTDRQGARDNFYIAASRAAGQDLRDFFANTLRWTISASANPFTFTWTGSSNGLWDNTANWTTPPGKATPDEDYDLVVLTGGTNPGVDLHGNRIIKSLHFASTTTSAFTLSNSVGGASLTIADGGEIVKEAAASSLNHTISSPITLAGDATFSNAGSWVHQANKLVISGTITGSGNLHITGSTGGVELAANNASTFTGTLSLDSGMLLLSNANGMGSTATAAQLNGGEIWFAGGVVTPKPLVINGDVSQSSLSGGAGVSGNITINSGKSFTITNGGGNDFTLSGAIGGAGELRMPTGNTTISGSSSNTLAGKLTLSPNSGNATYNQLRLAKTGGAVAIAGPLELQNQGTVIYQGANQIGDSSVVTLNGANTRLRLAGYSDTIGGLQGGASGSGVVENESGAANTGTLTVNTGGGSYSFAGILRNGDGSGTDGTLAFTKTGSGTQTLTGANTFTGQLTVADGTLSVPTINAPTASGPLGQSTSNIVLGGSGTTGILQYTGGSVTSSRNWTLASGGSGGFDVSNVAATLTLSGVISGSGGLVKNGTGTMIPSGNNTYTGPTVINAGVLHAGRATTAFGSNSDITVASGAVLRLFGYSNTVGSLSGTGYVDNNSSTTDVTLTLSGSNTATFSGNIRDANRKLALTKSGTGRQNLNTTNTYTGATIVSGGTLALTGSGSINSTSGITVNGGTLLNNSTVAVNRSLTLTSGTIGGSGTFSSNISLGSSHIAPGDGGAGTLTVSGNVTMGSSSVLDFDLSSPTGSNDLLAMTGLLTLDGTINVTCSGTLAAGRYTLISGFSGLTNNTLNFGTMPSGHTYTITTDATHVYLNAAPEPATLALLAMGGLALLRRRR